MKTFLTCSLVGTLLAASLVAYAEEKAKEAPVAATAPATAPATTTAARSAANYGKAISAADIPTHTAAEVLAAPEKFNKTKIRITGTVGPVCQEKGCWMTVVAPDTKKYIFIKFQDPPEGRLIPLEAPKHDVLLEGDFVIGKMAEASARHFAEGMGASDEELQKIVGPQVVYTVRGVGVRIYDLAPATQPAQQ